MSLFFRIFTSLCFIFFASLQFNDTNDTYVWVVVYLLAAITSFFKKPIFKFEVFFLIGISSILFIKNADIIITNNQIEGEIFYELGGIFLILFSSYFKLRKVN